MIDGRSVDRVLVLRPMAPRSSPGVGSGICIVQQTLGTCTGRPIRFAMAHAHAARQSTAIALLVIFRSWITTLHHRRLWTRDRSRRPASGRCILLSLPLALLLLHIVAMSLGCSLQLSCYILLILVV